MQVQGRQSVGSEDAHRRQPDCEFRVSRVAMDPSTRANCIYIYIHIHTHVYVYLQLHVQLLAYEACMILNTRYVRILIKKYIASYIISRIMKHDVL